MGSASDKARFYLEQSVPELKEYEQKKIFLKDEITCIAKRRSGFEHKVNARGSLPSDYARYAEYEINVDALRRKRVKRLGIKKAPAYTGQRRIFAILDRATRKFPGDVGLWMQSIEYVRRQKAHKKLSRILTNALRLHPTKPDLWIYAAQFAIEEHADMKEARSYMQRGLRFCKTSKKLWLEYAKLEVLYIARISARRQILGLGAPRKQVIAADYAGEADADLVHLPELTGEGISPSVNKDDTVDEVALRKLDSSPAMSGAIPIAIFDEAMKQFQYDVTMGKAFYDLTADFENIPCLRKILDHVVETMLQSARSIWVAQAYYVKVAVAGIVPSSPDFPKALGFSLSRLKQAMSDVEQKTAFAHDMKMWLQALSDDDCLDPALHKVIAAHIRMLDQVFSTDVDVRRAW